MDSGRGPIFENASCHWRNLYTGGQIPEVSSFHFCILQEFELYLRVLSFAFGHELLQLCFRNSFNGAIEHELPQPLQARL